MCPIRLLSFRLCLWFWQLAASVSLKEQIPLAEHSSHTVMFIMKSPSLSLQAAFLFTLASIALSAAQCTFQGSLARREEPASPLLQYRENLLEEKREASGLERSEDLGQAWADKRAVCNSDNVLRALKANSAAATTFCETFINIPTVTKTATVRGVTASV